MSSLSVRPVLHDKITMMTCLQSELSGSRKFAPGIYAGSCAGPFGGPSFVVRVVLFAFMVARV